MVNRIWLSGGEKGGIGKTFSLFALTYFFEKFQIPFSILELSPTQAEIYKAYQDKLVTNFLDFSMFESSEVLSDALLLYSPNLIVNVPANFYSDVRNRFTNALIEPSKQKEIVLVWVATREQQYWEALEAWYNCIFQPVRVFPKLVLVYRDYIWGGQVNAKFSSTQLGKKLISEDKLRNFRIPTLRGGTDLVPQVRDSGFTLREIVEVKSNLNDVIQFNIQVFCSELMAYNKPSETNPKTLEDWLCD